MPHPSGNGRPVSALKPQVVQAFATLVRAGLCPAAAARELGVAKTTLNNWMRWGRGRNSNAGVYGELIEAIEDAQREREETLFELIEQCRSLARQPAIRRQANRAVL